MANFWDNIGQKVGEVLGELAAPQGVISAVEEGARALEQGDLPRAEAALRDALAEDAGHGRAWQLLGLCLMGQGRIAEGIAALERALELRGADLALLATLMEAHLQAGDRETALRRGREALRAGGSERELGRVHRTLGRVHLLAGAYDHAVRELRKAVAFSDGTDLELFGLLGRAQAGAGDPLAARHNLSRAAALSPPDGEVLSLLARLELEQGRPGEARLSALRLLEQDPGNAGARLILARCLLAEGQGDAARSEALHALAAAPQSAQVRRLLGEVHARSGDLAGAAAHLGAALDLTPAEPALRLPLLRALLALELELEQPPGRLEADARDLLALEPADPLGHAALGLTALLAGHEVLLHLEASLAAGETQAGRMLAGLHALYAGRTGEAARALEAALRLGPGSRRTRSLLEQAQRARAGLEVADPQHLEIYPHLPALQALLEAHPALGGLAPEVSRVREVFDRPLMVCVMGEFSSGKSTFVNALMGEEVAAMGVTPTTATINLLKFGERRLGRVIWRDDREELLAWSEVQGFLAALSEEQAAEVRLVELLFPSEELLRVNVIDTPGLNSLVESHEQTAREVLGRADAVIWLFSAQQAGKQTEQQALDLLGRHRLKTVGVLNKVDQLSDEELRQVLTHLRQSFAGLTDSVIPVSTRQALQGMVRGDEELLARSRFPRLRAHLEQELFARSREIKRRASRLHLEDLLGQAGDSLARICARLDDAAAALEATRGLVRGAFPRPRLGEEAELLARQLREVYARGAAEVLDFVRPRRWALGEHRTTPADRDFLLELLLDGLRRLCDDSEARMARQLRLLTDGLRNALLPALQAPGLAPLRSLAQALDQDLYDHRLALLQQQVYTRYTAYARGYLAGGRVDSFLARTLPRLRLDAETVQAALWEDRVDLDQELLLPLGRWQQEVCGSAARLLDRLELELLLLRVELEERFTGPLARFARDLAKN